MHDTWHRLLTTDIGYALYLAHERDVLAPLEHSSYSLLARAYLQAEEYERAALLYRYSAQEYAALTDSVPARTNGWLTHALFLGGHMDEAARQLELLPRKAAASELLVVEGNYAAHVWDTYWPRVQDMHEWDAAAALPYPRAFSAQKYNVAVCCIFRDEGPYLREWLEYHLMLGVEHFYLWQHNSSPADPWERVLAPYEAAGVVTLHHARNDTRQGDATHECTRRYAGQHAWLGFFDIDEFVVLKRHETIGELLEEYEQYNALFLAEQLMSFWPHREPPALPADDPRRALGYETVPVVESNTYAISPSVASKHYGKLFVNTAAALERCEWMGEDGGWYHNCFPEEVPVVDELGRPCTNRYFVMPSTHHFAAIFHYRHRSASHCLAKIDRGYSWYEARFGSADPSEWPKWAREKVSTTGCEKSLSGHLPAPDASAVAAADRFRLRELARASSQTKRRTIA
eukprot:TRINITY_DN1715_c0_g1_i6.p2 TRINITY_DN1715_c0_g1~~TRINITY_DN1715_c0_g1_i6.p2  ORF type:complete len:504 (-),score=211.74 TRINITY_DN1715_c0_g1_i6:455-1831(-)